MLYDLQILFQACSIVTCHPPGISFHTIWRSRSQVAEERIWFAKGVALPRKPRKVSHYWLIDYKTPCKFMSNFTTKKTFHPFASISLPQLPHVSLPETFPKKFLKSFARRQRRSRVGSTGRFKLNSSTTAANRATKSMMLKGVLQNFTSPSWIRESNHESESGERLSCFVGDSWGGATNSWCHVDIYVCQKWSEWSCTKFWVASMSA